MSWRRAPTGCSDARIIVRHVLPNVTGPLVVQATVLMGHALLAEAGLSFLGLGAQPPEASWGAMLGTSFPYHGAVARADHRGGLRHLGYGALLQSDRRRSPRFGRAACAVPETEMEP